MIESASATRTGKIAKADAAWRAQLPAGQCDVTRSHRTARAETSELYGELGRSIFACPCCGGPLLALDAKFDFGAGWTSCDTPAATAAVTEPEDCNPFMRRTELRCARCQGHLRVFSNGASETMGLSASGAPLQFKPGGT